jgi:hypothetical protein
VKTGEPLRVYRRLQHKGAYEVDLICKILPIASSTYYDINEVGIEHSVGSVGDWYGQCETINGLYKADIIRLQGPWRGIEAVEFATLQ